MQAKQFSASTLRFGPRNALRLKTFSLSKAGRAQSIRVRARFGKQLDSVSADQSRQRSLLAAVNSTAIAHVLCEAQGAWQSERNVPDVRVSSQSTLSPHAEVAAPHSRQFSSQQTQVQNLSIA